jgi:hypothetical protein
MSVVPPALLRFQTRTNLALLINPSLALILMLVALSGVSAAQTSRREVSFPVAIQWDKQTGTRTYRLQIAADEKFQDVFFDGRVAGERYVATELPPGYYFWRVGQADSSVSSFSPPVRFFVSGGIVTPVKLPNRAKRVRPPSAVGTRDR